MIPPWLPQRWHQALPSSEPMRSHALAQLAQLAEESCEPWTLLSAMIDESRHSVAQWLAALAVFRQWLQQQQRQAPVSQQIGYLLGCSLAREADLGWDLPTLAETILQEQGFTSE